MGDLVTVPSIEMDVKRADFSYLWIKYVRAFDIRRHCAAGLPGAYSKLLPYHVRREPHQMGRLLDESQFKFIYVCGNTGVWAKNLHIAARAKPGGVIEYEDERIRVVMMGLEQVPIHPIPDPLGLSAAFMTCRNFQFGYEYLGGREQWKRQQQQRQLFGNELSPSEVDAQLYQRPKRNDGPPPRERPARADDPPPPRPQIPNQLPIPPNAKFEFKWFWKTRYPDRHGKLCRIAASDGPEKRAWQFEDGSVVVESKYAARKVRGGT